MGHSKFKSLQHHFDNMGLVQRVHGNTKRLPSNTSSQVCVDRVLAFIDTTANVHGLPLPGRMPNHRDSDIILLPSDMSKSFVYHNYVESSERLGEPYLCRRKFEDLWKELQPSILTNKPATDLCFTCQQNGDKLAKAFLLPESEREALHASAMEHLQKARIERQNYRHQCEKSERHGSYIVALIMGHLMRGACITALITHSRFTTPIMISNLAQPTFLLLVNVSFSGYAVKLNLDKLTILLTKRSTLARVLILQLAFFITT